MIYGSIVITKIDAYNLTVVLVGAALSGAGKRARCLREPGVERTLLLLINGF